MRARSADDDSCDARDASARARSRAFDAVVFVTSDARRFVDGGAASRR